MSKILNKIAIIGDGASAKNFIKALNYSNYFVLKKIAVRNQLSANKIKKLSRYNPEIVSIENLIEDQDIKNVIICLPPYIQKNLIEKLVYKNKNLILEKPVFFDFNKIKNIKKIIKKNNNIILVNHILNFVEEFKFLRKFISKKKNNLRQVFIKWIISSGLSKQKKNWKLEKKFGSGMIENFGSHIFNIFNLENSEILYKNIVRKNIGKNYFCNENVYLLLKKNGIIYNIFFSNSFKPTLGFEIFLLCKDRFVKLDNYKSGLPFDPINLKIIKGDLNIIENKIFFKKNLRLSHINLYRKTIDLFEKRLSNLKKFDEPIYDYLSFTKSIDNFKFIKKIYEFR